MITSAHYAVLRRVAHRQLSVEEIAASLYMTAPETRRVVQQMASPQWDPWTPLDGAERRGRPWLTYRRSDDTAAITTDGHRALAEAQANPRLQHDLRRWVDEARTGITDDGRRSGITRAAVPTGSTVSTRYRFPTRGGTRRQRRRENHHGQLLCRRCQAEGRPPWKPPEAFRSIGDGLRRPECKACERRARRKKRKKSS